MNLIIILKYIKKIIKNPSKNDFPINVFRTFFRMQRVFDFFSLFIQLLDLKRVKKLSIFYKEDKYYDKVKQYNGTKTKDKLITTTRRAEELYQIISTLSGPYIPTSKLLIVGPRNVQELFLAWTFGFKWKNIAGIDLYSTNKKIKVMDMSNMNFAEETFDYVSMANTLTYAKDVNKVLIEVARVLKPGGMFVFGLTYSPEDKEWHSNHLKGGQIKVMLSKSYLNIISCISSDKVNAINLRQTKTIIVCRKNKSKNEFLDMSLNEF